NRLFLPVIAACYRNVQGQKIPMRDAKVVAPTNPTQHRRSRLIVAKFNISYTYGPRNLLLTVRTLVPFRCNMHVSRTIPAQNSDLCINNHGTVLVGRSDGERKCSSLFAEEAKLLYPRRHRRGLLTYPKKKKEGKKEATVCTRMSDRRRQDLVTSEAVRANERRDTKMDRNMESSVEGACVKTSQTERRDTRERGWKESNTRLEEVVPEGRGRAMETTRACKDTLGPRMGRG
ncbi:hypothetical protein ALC57_03166, partial [Trachymyrmex cornetzi]